MNGEALKLLCVMRPKVSVVIPVYNRAHTVLPTLESVQAQTMPSFECIIVDDGSRDGDELRQVVESLNDTRFRYVRRPNGGGGAARNTGIDQAKAHIIAFLDSDDRWLPDKLERDLAAGADQRVVFSAVQVERAGRIVGRRPRSGPRPGETMGDYLACRQGFVQTSTVALPTSLARRVRFLNYLPFGQDADFAIRLADAGSRFAMLADSSVIMTDDEDAGRTSRSRDFRAFLNWVEESRSMLTTRAYLAMRGWHGARLTANAGHLLPAIALYGTALRRGALPPALAAKALAQIFVATVRAFRRAPLKIPNA